MKYPLLPLQKNSVSNFILLLLFLTLFLSSSLLKAATGGVYVELFKLQPVAKIVDSYKIQGYKVQANVKYKLTDYLHEALLNGVTLKARLEFYYYQPDNWFWDKKELLADVSFQLKYHPLSRHYLLSRNDTDEHWNFGNLPATLRKMGEVRNFKLPILKARSQDDNHYVVTIAYLEPASIDLPLRLQSLLSEEYSLESAEVQWRLP